MARKKEQQKIVRLTIRDPRYAGPGLRVGNDEWAEEIGPASTDQNVLALARGAVEVHAASWLIYFTTGELVGLWKPPTIVEALGLDYATDRKRYRLWQVEGMALVEAAKLTETVADVARVIATDYRVEGARVMRRGSASAQRAKAWCEQYDHLQAHSPDPTRPPNPLPPLPIPPAPDPTPEILAYYREAMGADPRT
jgi:hypothetical protein